MLLAECKYRNELTDTDIIDSLLDKSKIVKDRGLEKRYVLFSKTGFTKVAELRAEKDGMELIRLEDMFRRIYSDGSL